MGEMVEIPKVRTDAEKIQLVKDLIDSAYKEQIRIYDEKCDKIEADFFVGRDLGDERPED